MEFIFAKDVNKLANHAVSGASRFVSISFLLNNSQNLVQTSLSADDVFFFFLPPNVDKKALIFLLLFNYDGILRLGK